jgi:hypothetical protein
MTLPNVAPEQTFRVPTSGPLHMGPRSDYVVSGAIGDFLIDLMTLAFVTEVFGNHLADAARKLARRRLSKVRLLTKT